MHVPDGYLAPAFSLGMGLLTVPSWVVASQKVRKELSQRSVPLMAIFSAFTFTIMMFNVPVPGGTTAHGVGGTLAAIVLGPAAAVITVSVALIIQALFFGDGGVLAIFANCFNMAVLLPMMGYFTYRLIAGNSPLLSTRRAWAAGIGGYVGITIAAIAVGIELGLQPALFNDNGRPLYSPYDIGVAVPAMLIAHMFGASLVEGIITGLGFAYMQQHHPEYLTSLKRFVVGGATVATGETRARPTWQLIGGAVFALVVVFATAGFVFGGGDPGTLFGADWSSVDLASVATMLLFVAIIAAILIPLAWFLLPKRIRSVGTAYVAAAVFAPLGLIAPGFAYGEGGPKDLQKELGYIPEGLQNLAELFSAPFKDYNLPFFDGADAPLWHAALGYEIAGILGILLVGLVLWGIGSVLLRPDPVATSSGSLAT
jgi:cobalt/nickel transport system permease protein